MVELDPGFEPELLGDLLDRAADTHPERIAVVGSDVRLDYRTFRERVARLSGALAELGVRPDERVAVLDKNSAKYLELYFGIPRAGAVAVPLNYRLAPAELAYILGDSTATTLFFSSEYAPQVDALRAELPSVQNYVCLESKLAWALYYEALLASSSTAGAPAPRTREDVVLQMYTSGTTGRPKGAMLTHGNMVANTLTSLAERDYSPKDTYLHVAPLYHCADLEIFYGMTFACAGNVVLREFRPEAVLEAIQRERVTVAFLVPAMINALLEHPGIDAYDISSLRLIIYGGSAIPEDRLRAALERLPCKLTQGYGLTETSPILTILPASDHVLEGPHVRRIQSCGRPARGVEVKIFDEHARECAPEVVGEIVARGQNIMKGYWKNPEATAHALRGGWFHTGDMGFRDADGYIYIVDRMKDMIVTGGENVYPREVEEVLYAHPDVLEAAVIGVPSERWGETVKAVVVLREGRSVGPDELIAFTRERVARYKAPTSIDFAGALPRNPSGKVLKKVLREPYWEGHKRRVN
jgi:long-chain acyl-CoA synthetase